MSPLIRITLIVTLILTSLTSCVSTVTAMSCAQQKISYQEPVVKRGEFPFMLRYELNGSTIEINDAMVCSYEGQRCEGGDIRDDWHQSLKSGPDKLFMLELGKGKTIEYRLGDCDSFMGRSRLNPIPQTSNMYADLVERSNHGFRGTLLDSQELLDKYKIRILQWEISTQLPGIRD